MLRRRREKERFLKEALPHMASLYRTAIRLTRNPDTAQDLVQETYKEAWSSFDRYRPDTNCRAWLFRIQSRLAGRLLREARTEAGIDLEEVPQDRLAQLPRMQEQLEANRVLEIIDSLPEHYRMVLLMADVEEFSYREIAEVTGVPLGTVMSRLNRARSLVRAKLSQLLENQRTGEG